MIVSLKNVSKSYTKGQIALREVDLEVEEGEFFCLVGPSGCGKSTLLKLVAGLEKPSSGQIEMPSNVSMVFQSGALFPWMSVAENVEFGLKMMGHKNVIVKEETRKYLEMVHLSHMSRKYPRQLSGGQKQRVGIARALAMSPKVLLLDEPFSALDPITTDELHADLLEIWEREKLTIIMVSHSLGEAVLLADRIGVMKQGKLQGIVEVNLKRPRFEEGDKLIAHVRSLKKLLEK